MSTPIEAEVIQPEQGQSMAVARIESGTPGILRPADTLDAIAEAFKEYQKVCERILTDDDYQEYQGVSRKKKSAWRKLATAFNVSSTVVAQEVVRTDKRQVLSASFTVRAFTGRQDNPGRQVEAVGFCDITEKCCASAKGEACHKANWKGHYCCKKDCDGRRHWSHPDHDVIATAQTRATNRAIADLIGCGEVSAEELGDDSGKPAGASGGRPAPARGAKASGAPSGERQQGEFLEEGGFESAGASKPPESKPATSAPKQDSPFPTPESLKKMITQLIGPNGEHRAIVTEYFRKLANPCPLMPNEELESLQLRFVPATTKQMRDLASAIVDFMAGQAARWAYPPHKEPSEPSGKSEKPVSGQSGHVPRGTTRPADVPRDPNPDPNSPDAPWRSFPVPFGKHAGTPLGKLDKKVLFGFWANFEVEKTFNGKPKKAETIERDEVFRAMLDEAGQHYDFQEPDDGGRE